MFPRGLRIHRDNRPIFDFPVDHPARRLLITHAECWRDCAGREIAWPGKESEAIDQSWLSSLDGRQWTFSGFVYGFVCFDLVLHGWLDRPPHLAADERAALEGIPKMRSLLAECRAACVQESNFPAFPLIDQVERLPTAWEHSVQFRIQTDRIAV
jgi:hypothetical protein